jgi:hypothetical protein
MPFNSYTFTAMPDVTVSVFRLNNARGKFVPHLGFEYKERNTGRDWSINCGGTRAYLVRFGDSEPKEEAADSHFMVSRVSTSLLFTGAGLFQPEAVGRLIFRNIEGPVEWVAQLDCLDPSAERINPETQNRFYDWCTAICTNRMLRRACDDAYLALTHPVEALVFVYRGLEWLKVGQRIEWSTLASDMGVSEAALRDFKKVANYETGVRHASETGVKMRAVAENYGTWVCGLVDAINAARCRLDPNFKKMSSEEVAAAVMNAMPISPYP